MSGPDYYQLLRVPRDADAATIRQAYVRLVKYVHPDVAGSDRRPAARLQDLQRAYRCLLDPEARRLHDAEIAETALAHAARLKRVQRRLRGRPRSHPRYKRADGSARPARRIRWRLVWLILAGAAVWVKVSAGY